MKKSNLIMTILVLILLATQTTFALGSLYARRPLSNAKYFPLWLKNYDATVRITDQMAVTHVDQTFKNESNERLEGIFFFPLPKNAIVMELILWINGKPVQAQVMDSDTAQSIYENTLKKLIDPALLEYMGNNVFKLSVFPIAPNGQQMSERRIEITYAELLPYDRGNINFKFFMKTVNLSSKPVERASIAMDITTQKPILSLFSPTHDPSTGIVITKISDHRYKVTYGEENAHSEKDLKILYELKSDDFELNHITYVPNTDSAMFFDSVGDHSYYLLWVTPPDSIAQSQVIKKSVVFVADISSSMAGERMVQLRQSLNSCVDILNDKDMFNIIAFNTGIHPFRDDLVSADSDANRTAAHDFINRLGEAGMTNMEDAFKTSLQSTWDQAGVNALVFLTDGKPTWPINTSAARVIDTVTRYNQNSVSIFTFGIGGETEEPLLKLLAKKNHGFSEMIMKDDSISIVMENFMHKISYPLIKNINVAYGGLDVYDIFPRVLPNLYASTQLTILGRYRNTGTFNITFSGTVNGEPFSLPSDLTFPAPMPNHPFVARMWASAKIDFLLEEIEIYGKQPELVNGVKYLGKRYSIITPFTSFLVIEPNPNPTLLEDKLIPYAKTLKLFNNYPNPFRDKTLIRFSIPKSNQALSVSMKIFDSRGKLIKALVNEMSMGGNYSINWYGKDDQGCSLGSGYYLAVLKVGTHTKMIKMKLIK